MKEGTLRSGLAKWGGNYQFTGDAKRNQAFQIIHTSVSDIYGYPKTWAYKKYAYVIVDMLVLFNFLKLEISKLLGGVHHYVNAR